MRRSVLAILLVAMLTPAGVVTAQSPSPSASPSAPSLPACTGTTTEQSISEVESATPEATPAVPAPATCLHAVEEVLAPPADLPSVQALLGEYPGTQQSNVLYRERPFKKLRTVTWDSLPPIGEAARLCLQGPHGLQGPAATAERQRGCFLAVRGEWERYLAAVPTPDAEAHFRRARAIHAMAVERLGDQDAAWLKTALARELPLVTPVDPAVYPEFGRTDVSETRFLKSKPRPVSAAAFLRAIRDAHAADRVLAPVEMSSSSWLGYEGGVMAGNGTPDFARGDRIVSVTLPVLCVRAVDTEPRGTLSSDGIAFTINRDQSACWPVVQALWRAYRTTNAPEYLEAARAAWDYFRSRFPERPGTPAFRRMTRIFGGL